MVLDCVGHTEAKKAWSRKREKKFLSDQSMAAFLPLELSEVPRQNVVSTADDQQQQQTAL